jgi:spore coat protein CotH
MRGHRIHAFVASALAGSLAAGLAFGLTVATPRTLQAQTVPAPAPTAPPDPSDAFFDDSVVHDIYLTINSRDWESLKVNYLDNTYYASDFKWHDQVVRNVAIRSRGTGSRSGVKPGLRVDFDRYTSGQQFLGLKSFILRNNTQDPSNLHERVSMLFFRRMGMKAEREAHAQLYINNVYSGLYTIVESLDETFLQRNLGESNGNLYEYKFDNSGVPPFIFGYPGSDPALYVPLPFSPETNIVDPRGDLVERLFFTINAAGDAIWKSSMAEFLDLAKFLRHLAIENFLAEEDGLTGDYGPNNFYVYRYVNKTLFMFLPWDKSNAFWGAPASDYSIFHNIEDGPENHRNRLVVRALADPQLREVYLNALLECADSAVQPPAASGSARVKTQDAAPQPGWMETEIQREYQQIRMPVLLDTTKLNSYGQFEDAVNAMTDFAQHRSDAVRQQVAADRAKRAALR